MFVKNANNSKTNMANQRLVLAAPLWQLLLAQGVKGALILKKSMVRRIIAKIANSKAHLIGQMPKVRARLAAKCSAGSALWTTSEARLNLNTSNTNNNNSNNITSPTNVMARVVTSITGHHLISTSQTRLTATACQQTGVATLIWRIDRPTRIDPLTTISSSVSNTVPREGMESRRHPKGLA